MPKFLLRAATLLLVPALLVDPAWAIPATIARPSSEILQAPFQQQALMTAYGTPLRPLLTKAKINLVKRWKSLFAEAHWEMQASAPLDEGNPPSEVSGTDVQKVSITKEKSQIRSDSPATAPDKIATPPQTSIQPATRDTRIQRGPGAPFTIAALLLFFPPFIIRRLKVRQRPPEKTEKESDSSRQRRLFEFIPAGDLLAQGMQWLSLSIWVQNIVKAVCLALVVLSVWDRFKPHPPVEIEKVVFHTDGFTVKMITVGLSANRFINPFIYCRALYWLLIKGHVPLYPFLYLMLPQVAIYSLAWISFRWLVGTIRSPERLLRFVDEKLPLLGTKVTDLKIKAIGFRWVWRDGRFRTALTLWLKEPYFLRWVGLAAPLPLFIVPLPSNWTKLREQARPWISAIGTARQPVNPIPDSTGFAKRPAQNFKTTRQAA